MGNAKKSGEAPELEKGTELFSFKFQINDVVRQSVSRDVYQSVARYFHPKSKNKYRTKREYLAERYLLCCFRTVDSNSQVILRVTFFQTEAKQKRPENQTTTHRALIVTSKSNGWFPSKPNFKCFWHLLMSQGFSNFDSDKIKSK